MVFNPFANVHVVRAGLDWLTEHYRQPCRSIIDPPMQVGDTMLLRCFEGNLPVIWREAGPRWVWQAPGLWIAARRPGSGLPPANQPAVVGQLQGHAWAAGCDAAVLRHAVEAACGLYPHETADGIPSRIDLAVDLWAPDGGLLDLLTAGGSLATAREVWGGQWRRVEVDEPARIIGCGPRLRTLYLGRRDTALLRVYRKNVEFEGNTADLYRDIWAANGYDGTGEIVRVEVELRRRWFKKQAIAGRNLDRLGTDELLELVPSIWAECCDRWKFLPAGDEWARVQGADFGGGAAGVAIQRADRAARIERALAGLRAATWRADAICGGEVGAAELAALARSEEYRHDREKWARRSPWARLADCGHLNDVVELEEITPTDNQLGFEW